MGGQAFRTRKPAVRRAVSNAPARECVEPQSDKVTRIIEPSTTRLRERTRAPCPQIPCSSVVTGQSAKAVSCPPCLFLHKFSTAPLLLIPSRIRNNFSTGPARAFRACAAKPSLRAFVWCRLKGVCGLVFFTLAPTASGAKDSLP